MLEEDTDCATMRRLVSTGSGKSTCRSMARLLCNNVDSTVKRNTQPASEMIFRSTAEADRERGMVCARLAAPLGLLWYLWTQLRGGLELLRPVETEAAWSSNDHLSMDLLQHRSSVFTLIAFLGL